MSLEPSSTASNVSRSSGPRSEYCLIRSDDFTPQTLSWHLHGMTVRADAGEFSFGATTNQRLSSHMSQCTSELVSSSSSLSFEVFSVELV